MSEFLLFLLFLMVVALGLALRRAFVRIDFLEREVRRAQPLVPQAVLAPESVLPPKGGSYRVEEETPLPESRSFRLQAEEGLRFRYAPIRYFAMVVFAVTILKVFAGDMAQLERIYRVSSVIGLGILLLLTSSLYNRSKRA